MSFTRAARRRASDAATTEARVAAVTPEDADPMPQYEYVCEKDGEVITLLRPMSAADAPVEDPKGLGRVFRRRHSVFGVGGASPAASGGGMSLGGCCPCGKNAGSCGASGN